MYIVYKNSVSATFQKSVLFLNQLIEEELDPYQIAFFSNNTNKSVVSQYEFMLQNIIQKFPVITIDFGILEFKSYSEFLSLKNARHVSLYVIIYYYQTNTKDIINSLQRVIDTIVNLSSNHPQPKCVMILYVDSISTQIIEEILIYAWSMKFLDFSVIEFSSNVFVHHFNPFYHVFHNLSLYAKNIFPDKLRDGNQYGLKTPIFDRPPYLKFLLDENKRVVQITGVYYALMKIAVKTLNFKYEPVLFTENVSFSYKLKKMFAMLSEGELILVPIPFPSRYRNDLPTINLGFHHDNTVAVVPILSTSILILPLYVFIYIFIIPSVVFCIVVMTNLFNNTYTPMRFLIIFKILIGATAYEVKNIQNRVTFLVIAFMSIMYSANLCTDLMNIKISQNEIFFDSFEAIDKSELKLYVHENVYSLTFANDDQDLQKLKLKTYNITMIKDCFETLIKKRNVICITPMSTAVMYAEYYQTSTGRLIMKIAKPLFYSCSWEFVFEKKSVYLKKFRNILLRIYEAGLNKASVNILSYKRHTIDDLKENSDTNLFCIVLLFIVTIGFFISFIVFLCELISNSSRV